MKYKIEISLYVPLNNPNNPEPYVMVQIENKEDFDTKNKLIVAKELQKLVNELTNEKL